MVGVVRCFSTDAMDHYILSSTEAIAAHGGLSVAPLQVNPTVS